MIGRALILTLALGLGLTAGLTADLAAGEPQVLGKGVTLDKATPVSKILADPEGFSGKAVRVEGEVLEVCAMAGCWMELKEAESGAKIRIKVDDGVIVFPKDAKGRTAVAEGTVELIPMSRESYIDWQKHIADEQGYDFDPKTVGEGPFRVVQLKGTGARIAG